jgi:hypothetical protein
MKAQILAEENFCCSIHSKGLYNFENMMVNLGAMHTLRLNEEIKISQVNRVVMIRSMYLKTISPDSSLKILLGSHVELAPN